MQQSAHELRSTHVDKTRDNSGIARDKRLHPYTMPTQPSAGSATLGSAMTAAPAAISTRTLIGASARVQVDALHARRWPISASMFRMVHTHLPGDTVPPNTPEPTACML